MVDGTCISCWWSEGEVPYMPHWMRDQEAWLLGRQYGWSMGSKELSKLQKSLR